MAGALHMMLRPKTKVVRVTIGNSGTVYGFVSGSIGSVSPTTYSDHAGTSRSITAISSTDNGDATWTVVFRLNGTPADSNTVFVDLIVNGTRLTRASSSSVDLGGGVRQWAWTVGSNIIGAAGTANVIIT